MSTIISLVVTVLSIIASWKIFEKAGEKGWKSLIPIYNSYILFMIARNSGFIKNFVATCVLVVSLMLGIMGITVSMATGNGAVMAIGVVGIILTIVCMVYVIVLLYKMYADLAETFGHSRSWGILLLIPYLSIIFSCIIGFGSDSYRSDKEIPNYSKVVPKIILSIAISVVLCIVVVAGIAVACDGMAPSMNELLNSNSEEDSDYDTDSDYMTKEEMDELVQGMYDGQEISDLVNSEDGIKTLDSVVSGFEQNVFDGSYGSTYTYDVSGNTLIITNTIADDGSRFNVEDFNNLLDTNKMIPVYMADLTLAVQNRSSIKVIYSVMQGNNEIYNRTYDKGANSVTVNGEYYGTYEAVVQGKNTTE